MIPDRIRPLTIAFLVATAFLIAVPAHAETELMILLDASGSMASPGAPGSGSTKYGEVKAAITNMLQELPSDVSVGLRIMGGSEYADCYNSYLYHSPSQGIRSNIQDTVETIIPAGQRGLYQGIADGLDDLIGSRNRADRVLLVITDGGDSCDRDFDDLARAYSYDTNLPRLVIYGLDLSRTDLEILGEFAAELDGRIVDLRTITTLSVALIEFAAGFSNNLRIHLQDSSGTAIPGDIIIRNADTGLVVAERLDISDFSTNLPPGTYQVVARYLGQEIRTEEFTIEPDGSRTIPLTFEIYLDPLTVSLRDIFGHALRARITFLNSSGEPVLTTDSDTVHRVQLPPDNYSLEVRVGDHVEEFYGIHVGPGYDQLVEIEVPVELGVLEVEVANYEGLPVNAEINVYDEDGTLMDRANYSSSLYVRLPSGTYRVTAQVAGEMVEDTIYLYQGEQLQFPLEINVGLGDLFVRLRTESGSDVWGTIRVFDSHGNLVERFYQEDWESPDWAVSRLPVGTYRIQAEADNVIRVVTGVEIRLDEETEVVITFPDEVF